jgi:hypothetical protein
MLGITYKSAWFIAHRIREAMKPVDAEPMGGAGNRTKLGVTDRERAERDIEGKRLTYWRINGRATA